MFDSKSFPFDQVAQFPIDHFAIQNFFYNPFLFFLYDFWKWGGGTRSSAWDQVIWCRGQFDNIEDWV